MGILQSTQAIYEAFGRGDGSAILDLLADGIEWDQDAPSYGIPIFEPGIGKEHVVGFFRAVQEGLEFFKFEPTNFLAGGNQVAGVLDARARVKSTGKVLRPSRFICGPSATMAR